MLFKIELDVLENLGSPGSIANDRRKAYLPNAGQTAGIFSLDHWHQSQELSSFLSAIPAGIVLIDRFGTIVNANAMAESMLGGPLVGQQWRQVIERAFEPRNDDGFEVSLKDGRKVRLAISRLPSQPGQLIHLTDLTETRLLQAQVGHAQKLYSLGKMAASLAHQIRTPLSAAMLYASNLKSPGLPHKTIEAFSNKLQQHLQQVEGQINDFLMFVRKHKETKQDKIDLVPLVNGLAAELGPMFANKQVTLTLKVSTQHPLIVAANENALKGALQNLLNNALEASPQGTEVLLALGKANDKAEILVKDQGCGVAESALPSLFEPFYTTKQQGTGLGLAVVQTVVQGLGGSVAALNNDHRGATFKVRLPLLVAGTDVDNPQVTGRCKIAPSSQSQKTKAHTGEAICNR